MIPKNTAPEQILRDVKLAASISSPPKANRHKIELAAKATRERKVNNMVFIGFLIVIKKTLIFCRVVDIVHS